MKKRILSALLALCMVLTLLPAEALAAEPGESAEEQQDTALEPDDLEPGSEEPEESGTNGKAPMEDELSAEEASIRDEPSTGEISPGDESDLMPYADTTDSVDYTLENGAVLTFDPSSGTITKCTPNGATEIIIPEKINGVSVTSIGYYAFGGCNGLTSIDIPGSVTSIGERAFFDCSSLTSITIPDSITSIGDGAFHFCSGLISVTIPDNVTSIGEGVFGSCESLTSVTIPDSVTSIGSGAFIACTSLTSVTIPDSVTSIGDSAFYNCNSLTSITIPDSVTSIGELAFFYCRSLTSITIPDRVTSIGSLTFFDCSSLKSIVIPDSVTSIASSAFDGVHEDFTIYCYPGSYAETYAINNDIHYVYLQVRSLSVSILTPEDTPVTEGFTVTWYDESGNEVGAGLTLLGAVVDNTYAFDVRLGEALAQLYEQPERQTITPEDEAVRIVRLVPREAVPIPTLTLTGRVLDESGRPVAGAEISVGLESGKTADTVSGADGSFSVTVPYETVRITVQKDGYYQKTLVLDLRSETADSFRMDDCVLTEAVTISDRLTLNITQRLAAENTDQAIEIPVTSAKTLTFILTGSDNRSITDFEMQGTVLLFHSGAVSANETIHIRVEDPAGAYVGASADVKLDHNRLGSVELTMTQKGSFRLGGVSGPEARLFVFNDSGKCIQSATAQGGMSGGVMDAGQYRLVFLQKSSLLPSVPDFSYLQTLGLTAGRDYLLRGISIIDGKVSPVDDCIVPALNESVFSYIVAENTSVTTGKFSVAAGEQVLVRISYELDPAKTVSDSSLQIVLPDGVSVLENSSATVNGSQIPYTYDPAKREVRVSMPGQGNATVYFYCAAVEAGSHSIGAFLTLSNGAIQPVGSAVVQVETARLDVVERTGVAEGIVASGKTLPNSTVILYDNDEEVGSTKSNAVGSWSIKFNLIQPVYSYSYHFIRAVTESASLSETIRISTEEAMITYSKDSAGQVTKITMYNTGDHGPQTTVFDFTDTSSTARPYYRMWPSVYPTFTFKVEFSGNASKLSEVYVVTTNSAGEKTYVKTSYDSASKTWVGTHNYTSFNDAPVEVGAAYKGADDDEIFFMDEEMLADLEREFAELDNEILDMLLPICEEMFDVENVEQTKNSIQADVIFTDPATNERESLGSVRTSLDQLEPGITAGDLEKQGYQLIDEDNQIWANIGESNFEDLAPDSTLLFFDLKNEISLTVEINTADRVLLARAGVPDSAEQLAKSYSLWLMGIGLGLVIGGVIALGIVVAGPVTITAGAATAIGANIGLFAGSTIVTAIDAAAELSAFEKKLNRYTEARINTIINLMEDTASLINATCSTDGSHRLSEEDKAEFKSRLGATWTVLSAFETESAARVSKIKNALLAGNITIGALIQLALNPWPKENNTVDMNGIPKDIAGIMAEACVSNKQDAAEKIIEDILQGQINADYEKIVTALKKLQSDIKEAYRPCSGDDDELPLDMVESPGKSASYIADPSGYVYEAVPSNRLEDVEAVISSEAGGVWNAADYDQINPQNTDSDGSYYWDVPQGNWKVNFTKEGYEPVDTSKVATAVNGWLPVPPPQLEINVAMVSTASPAVKQTVAYTDRAEVEFSQYMDIDSVMTALSLTAGGIDLSDVDIEALDAEDNLEKTAQYATRFAVVYRGNLAGEVVVSVAGSAKNYAGRTLQSPYKSEALTVSERPTGIDAPEAVSIGMYQTVSISFDLAPGVAGKELKVKSLTEDLVRVITPSVTTNAYGEASIKLEGLLPGSGLIQITEPVSGVSTTIRANISLEAGIEPVTASLRDGTVVTTGMTLPAGTAVYLSTATEGAVIRYTLDNTCPCKEAALQYSEPIALTKDTVLRAAAWKDDVYSATIRLELYVNATNPGEGNPGGGNPGGGGSSSGTSYQIIVPTVSNGTVTITPKSAKFGTKVTITAAPNNGYTTDSVTVTDRNGKSISVTNNGDGTYTFIMPASQVTVSVTFAAIETPWGNPFTDVSADGYYYDAVAWAVELGITQGTSATTFDPYNPCTRAQIVTFLWRAAGSPTVTTASKFTDVSSSKYYSDAVAWAVQEGITYGTSATAFSPNDTCTRAQAVTFLYRAKNSPAVSGTNNFTDVVSGAYYTDAVQWAVNTGATKGTSTTTFSPKQTCTRAQIVTFLYRDRKG